VCAQADCHREEEREGKKKLSLNAVGRQRERKEIVSGNKPGRKQKEEGGWAKREFRADHVILERRK